MAQNKPKVSAKEKPGDAKLSEAKPREGGGWLKLPKMWADAEETSPAQSAAAEPSGTEPSGTEPIPANESATDEAPSSQTSVGRSGVTGSVSDEAGGGVLTAPERGSLEYYESLGAEAEMRDWQAVSGELAAMKGEMERMHHMVSELNERESSMEQVFNTLHSELMGYKKDFIYEHLKPVVRPLLFLYDSLEQFDHEIEVYERPVSDERRQEGLSPRLVRENIGYFREQLVEALRICEVTLMEEPGDEFDSKRHKAIDVAAVDEAQDGKIVRVVRTGWSLNNQVLRPVEVVLGKAGVQPKDEPDQG